MNTISDEYRALNARAHQDNDGFGVRGFKHLPKVLQVAERLKAETVLDYGCGGNTLAAHARRVSALKFAGYDPAIPEYAAEPTPVDLLVCTDVLEHVEPLYLTNVMEHIDSLVLRGVYLNIACRPAKRVLADGRNAHILVRNPEFWFDVVRQYFDVIEYKAVIGHSVSIVATREGY